VIDKSKRDDGTFSREDFTFDKERNVYISGRQDSHDDRPVGQRWETTLLYFASVLDCRSCLLKARCCPKMAPRRIPRSIYEEARDVARALAKTKAFEQSRRDRKRVEMLFAHLKRILRLGRLRLRGPRVPVRVHAGGDRTEPSSARKAGRTATPDHANRVRGVSSVEFVAS